MFKAKAVHLKKDIKQPSNCIDIESIKIDVGHGAGVWEMPKKLVYGLVEEGITIIVDNPNIKTKPPLTTAISPSGEKYVKSESDDIVSDNLLNLPKF